MNALEFLSSVIDSLAWPVSTIILALIMREPLAKLIPFLKHFKFKELEVRFGEEIDELKKANLSSLDLKKQNEQRNTDEILEEHYVATQSLETLKEKLLSLAEISPSAAIMDAWTMLETEIFNVAYRLDLIEKGKHQISPKEILYKLETKNHIDKKSYAQVLKLLELRNMVAHSKTKDLDKEDVIEYCLIAYEWISYWRGFCFGFTDATSENEFSHAA